MKQLIRFFNICLCFFSLTIRAQQSSFLPVNLGKGINTEYDEINPVLAPDGKTLYFVRINHPLNTYGKHDSQDVWYSEIQPDGSWGEAKHFDNFINGARYNAVLSISSDGKRLLISGVYSGAKRWYKNGLSIVSRFGEEWSIPEQLKIPRFNRISEGQNINAYMSYDGTYLLLASTKRFNGKKLNIYVTKNEDGSWTKPIKLGPNINTKMHSEEAPFLSSNNEVLYFSSKRKDGTESFDIYKSNRMTANWKEWTTPVLLNDTINTKGYESYFKINRRGTHAYYASTTNSLAGSADIFKIKLIEEQPFVVVTGHVLNKQTNLPIINKKDYIITINDKKLDSVKINFDSASFKIRLPFGKKYVLKPVVKNYITQPDTLDVTNVSEYTEYKKDLFVKPIPYVLVKGRFMDKNTGLLIPAGAKPRLVLNGVISDSIKLDTTKSALRIKVDTINSSYIAKLPFGENYHLNIRAFKYKPVLDSLDLSKITEYQEISKSLYGEKEMEKLAIKAIISGKVFNKKTGKPMDSTVAYSVVVDSLPGVYSQINKKTAEYSLEVMPGKSYTIGAKAERFYPVFEKIDLSKEKGSVKVIKDLVIAPIEVGQAVRMNNIFFISGKAQLTPASYPELNKLAKFLIENPYLKVEIAGHTDNVGKKDKNMQLSRWRARAVELYLESKGVPVNQVTFNGYGDSKPVASNKTPWGKSQNRRVEFVIKDIAK